MRSLPTSSTLPCPYTTMDCVMDMNNEGALLIEDGKYKPAIAILSQGIAKIHSEIKIIPGDQANKEDDCRQEEEEEDTIYACQWAEEFRARQKMQQLGTNEEDFVYRHPILALDLPKNDEAYLLSIMLVFNMALCQHLMALEGEEEQQQEQQQHQQLPVDLSARLKGALTLYELGFNLQRKTGVQMDMTIALAMVNNCAHIHKALNRPQKAGRLIQHMVSSLMMVIENGQAKTVHELDGFLYNASRLILTRTVAAAA